MPDAEIIPIGSTGRPGRGSGRAKPSSAARSLSAAPAKKVAVKKTASKEAPAAKKVAPTKAAPAKKTAPAKKSTAKKAAPTRKTAAKKPAPRVSPSGKISPTGTTSPTGKPIQKLSIVLPNPPVSTPPPAPAPARTKPVAAAAIERGIPVTDWISAILGGAREVFGDDWERGLATAMAVVRRRLTGEYEVDEFGFDAELADTFFMAVLRPIANKWFRVEVRGIENIPTEGGALVVSNHSGTLPMDGLVTAAVVNDRTGRNLRALGADLVFALPVVANIARKGGATLACKEDAERMLTNGELVGVWPEGFKGLGKPFSERYKLQRFGRGGFVSAALKAGVPIIPLSVVGAEEIYPMVGNATTLARLFGVPYLPITPFFPWLGPLGAIPLPSKWIMEFGEPIRTDEYDPVEADDPMLMFNVTDQVRETIQQTLFRLLMQRESVFF